MKTIQLSRNLKTIVDDEDYIRLAQFKWCADKAGYAVRSEPRKYKYAPRKILRMHREILNAPDELLVDHINHDIRDNRKSNLRLVTRKQSQQNRRKTKANKSGYKNVWWDSKRERWVAYIKYDGKVKPLGRYTELEAAAIAYNNEAKKIFGEYACLNEVGK